MKFNEAIDKCLNGHICSRYSSCLDAFEKGMHRHIFIKFDEWVRAGQEVKYDNQYILKATNSHGFEIRLTYEDLSANDWEIFK